MRSFSFKTPQIIFFSLKFLFYFRRFKRACFHSRDQRKICLQKILNAQFQSLNFNLWQREIYYARDENNESKNNRCNMFFSNDCSQKYFDAHVGGGLKIVKHIAHR